MTRKHKLIPAEVAMVLEAWQSAPDSLRVQCQRRNVPYWKARYWIKKQGLSQLQSHRPSEAMPSAAATPDFIRVDVPQPSQACQELQLTLPSGATLIASDASLPELFSLLRQYGLC
jgi:hypothetical protein